MRKASILSFQFADNYGALLQIYALSQKVLEQGISVEVIDYEPKRLVEPYKLGFNIIELIKTDGLNLAIKKSGKKILSFKKNYKRKINFNSFRQNHINLTSKKYISSASIKEDATIYKYCIVGSDQVWNPVFLKESGNTYFLDFATKNSKKIAYAASLAEDLNEEDINFFKKELNQFDYISVREKSAQQKLSNLTKKEILTALDPTLLLKSDEWEKLIENDLNLGKYILVYDLDKDSRIVELANIISQQTGYKIISYSNKKGYVNWHSTFYGDSPEHFLALFKSAEFVLTSSFHGTAFSIIFEKQFYSISHRTRGSRMVDLLDSLGLGDRLIEELEVYNYLESKLDYAKPIEKLSKLRKESMDFLVNSLRD